MVATLIRSTLLWLEQNFGHSKWNYIPLYQVEITDNSTATLVSRGRKTSSSNTQVYSRAKRVYVTYLSITLEYLENNGLN